MSGLYPGVVILGPTASGKSSLAMALAARFRVEIISCDALQVYRGMDVGTAKPTLEDCESAPHHMLDLRNPGEDFSAGDYQRLAREALEYVCSRGHLPLVVGGAGFYIRALIDGLFEGPGRSAELRSRMREIVRRGGARRLYAALRRCDPEATGHIAPADSERIIRAYEVYLESGKPMSWWQRQQRNRLTGYCWLKLGVSFPREVLYERIDQRVQTMFAAGFIEEVDRLLRQYPRECHAFKAIGYRQIVSYLEGGCGLEGAISDTQMESRRYAKRQLTWFRADPEIVWLDGMLGLQQVCDSAAQIIKDFLDRSPD